MEDLRKRIEKMSSSERCALTALIHLADKYPDSFTTLDNRFNRQAQIMRQIFDTLRQDSRFGT